MNASISPLTDYFIQPTRIVWLSSHGVKNAEALLQANLGQAVIPNESGSCVLDAAIPEGGGILLDFGRELHGFVEIFTPMTKNHAPCPVRVRFGESVSEAMAELGGEKNSQNDHAIRDEVVLLPWLGKRTIGPSGFRFLRIDAVDPERPVEITQVQAVLRLRNIPKPGSFSCNDKRLNQIWETGAYTVHLNMQEYLWDGIKRDRLVWVGDMHPEVSTIHSVFGFNEVVPQSLDLTCRIYPPTSWVSGISSYSLWWIIIQHDFWMHHARRDYLEAQRAYLVELLVRLTSFVDVEGRESLHGFRFLDWPTNGNDAAVNEGLRALLIMGMEAGGKLCDSLGESQTAQLCQESTRRLKQLPPGPGASKQSMALQMLAGLIPPQAGVPVLKKDGPKGLSTFFGYYVLEALALAGETETAQSFISQYWGGMLDFGATTFWEDFDLAWTENAGRIDELVPAGMKDLHGDFGAHCYIGFRHSLCHGWASGPTAWLSRHVLGIHFLEPGGTLIEIKPQLGKLEWAEGSYPTPYGAIHVRHERQADGSIQSVVRAPDAIQIAKTS